MSQPLLPSTPPAEKTAAPVVVRAQRGWLRAGGYSPPPRRPRSLWVRILVALTSTTAILATATVVAAAAIIPPIGARRAARETALREIGAQLSPDEHVVAQAFASQRRWTDMWRESFGVLVATDRRLLYVGAPSTPLLHPPEEGPAELLVQNYPYDAAFTLEPRSVWRGRLRGLTLRTPVVRVDFIIDARNWPDAQRVAVESARARGVVSREIELLDASLRAPPPVAAEYVFHIVRRGETLTGLAQHYRTSPDVLRQLNQLTGNTILIGQRLRVPKPEPDTTRTP